MTILDAPRLLPLEGGFNLRDLGGYAARNGRAVRRGMLYRSGMMSMLTEADERYLGSLGIATVCDFRRPGERRAEPTRWCEPAGVHYWARDYSETTGVLAKLFSEAVESIDMGPVEGVHAAGGTRIQAVRWGIIPQVLPLWTSFALYRFETNARSSTVLGIIGAGGIGALLLQNIRGFYYERTAAIVRGSSDNTKRFHNPALGSAEGAAAYVEREFQPEKVRQRYDWLYEYDALTVAL